MHAPPELRCPTVVESVPHLLANCDWTARCLLPEVGEKSRTCGESRRQRATRRAQLARAFAATSSTSRRAAWTSSNDVVCCQSSLRSACVRWRGLPQRRWSRPADRILRLPELLRSFYRSMCDDLRQLTLSQPSQIITLAYPRSCSTLACGRLWNSLSASTAAMWPCTATHVVRVHNDRATAIDIYR